MKKVEIYTDGACSGNPGVGGWCAILKYKDVEKILSGGIPNTTNNRMEVFSVIQGLAAVKIACEITVYSDSAYLINAVNDKWLDNWQSNNWRTAAKDDVKNKDLWLDLLHKLEKHKVKFIKVKGHSDNEYNNKCDKIAKQEIKNVTQKLKLNLS